MARRSRFIKPEVRQVLTAEVVASKQLSPNFVRVTLGGEGLRSFTPMGYDQWFRLFLPRDGQTTLRLPTRASALWYAQYLMMSTETRPAARNYTVRAYRPDGPELDIDFVTHGDGGPASAWAQSVAAGTEVGLLDEGLIYQPVEDVEWQLIVGDESALPAIAGILGSSSSLRAEVFLEIPHPDDAQDLAVPDGVELHWLPRTDPHARPGALAAATVEAATLPLGPCYAFLAGESQLVTGLRRHLVEQRGMPKPNVAFTGYWRHGKAASK